MPKKIIVGFQVSKEEKEKMIEAGKKFEFDGVPHPLNLSGFCRIATEKFLLDIIKKEKGSK